MAITINNVTSPIVLDATTYSLSLTNTTVNTPIILDADIILSPGTGGGGTGPHDHNTIYYTETEINNLFNNYQPLGDYATNAALTSGLSGKAPTSHTHPASSISDSGTTGRALIQSATTLAARTAIGAATTAQGALADTAVQPAGLNKAAVGLGNVDNTSDLSKPVSTATQTALNGRVTEAELTAHAIDTTAIHGIADTSALVLNTDSRLSDQRIPTDISVTTAKVASANKDGAATTPSMRTLGTGATQASAGNHGHTQYASNTHATSHTAGGTDPLLITNAQITDRAAMFAELFRNYIIPGANTTKTVDNATGVVTIAATASGGTGGITTEDAILAVNNALIEGSGIIITRNVSADSNPANDTITIASNAVLPTRQIISGTGLTGGGDLSINRTLSVTYGTAAGTALQGNDPSRTNTRIPTDNTVTTVKIVDLAITDAKVAAANKDGLVGTPSLRTLGTGAQQAAAGNHGHTEFATTAQGTKADTAVQPSRQVISGNGLTGGGDFSANRTLAVTYGTTAGTATQGNDSRVVAGGTAVQPAGLTKAAVGLGSVDNTADTAKPVSTAQQTALNAKAPIASPTFTGTVAGVTKAHVGLPNVDNTTDANKPVSTATATALAGKQATFLASTTPLAAGVTPPSDGIWLRRLA